MFRSTVAATDWGKGPFIQGLILANVSASGPDRILGGVRSDKVFAHITGYFVPSTLGSYQFNVSSDSGSRLFFNDGSGLEVAANSTTFALSAGTYYPLELEYYHNSSAAWFLRLEYSIDGSARQIVPSSMLARASDPATNGVNVDLYNLTTATANIWRTNQVLLSACAVAIAGGNATAATSPPFYNISSSSTNVIIRYTGYFRPPASAFYNFTSLNDDGARMVINLNDGGGNREIISYWKDSAAVYVMSNVTPFLSATQSYWFAYEYYQKSGKFVLRLSYSSGGTATVISSSTATFVSPTAAPSTCLS